MSEKVRERPIAARVTLCILFFLVCGVSSAFVARAEDQLVKELLEKMSNTRVESSRAYFARQILMLDPSAPIRSFCDGYLLLLAGDDAAAESKLDAALAKEKKFGEAPYMYGDVYGTRGRQIEAIAAYRRALALEPKLLSARLALGRLLLERAGQSTIPDSTTAMRREAIEVIRRGLDDFPQEASLQVAIGDALVAAGQLADAVSPYVVADQLEPGRADIESKLGFLYADLGEIKPAQSYLAMSLQSAPNNPAAVRRLADLYGNEGRIVTALMILSQGWKPVRDTQEQARIRRAIGFGLLVFGDRVKSREHLEQARDLLKDNETELALAWIDSTTGSTDSRALELARLVLPTWNFRWLDEERMKIDACWPPPEVAPRLVRAADPVYPPEARQRGNEGETLVSGLVSPEGDLLEVKIAESSGYADMDAAALTAMRQSTVTPAVSSGSPVACWIQVPFRFSLHGGTRRMRDGNLPGTAGTAGERVIEHETPTPTTDGK
jgi:TonB family protein